MSTRKILIPLDQTDYSLKILATINHLIPTKDTTLILYHVAHPPAGVGLGEPDYTPGSNWTGIGTMEIRNQFPHPIYADQQEQSLKTQIEYELGPYAVKLNKDGYQVSIMVGFGDPVEEILNLAKEEAVDFIAMTTHAREGIGMASFAGAG